MTSAITDLDALFNANLDDIDDLPPVGCPPTGCYNLLVSATREASKESGNEFVKFSYEVTAINEVKNPEEANQAAVGMKFTEFFSPFKKDGTPNEWGQKFLKQAIKPFAEHFGARSFGEALAQINKIEVMAVLVRVVDKKDDTKINARLSDVTIL